MSTTSALATSAQIARQHGSRIGKLHGVMRGVELRGVAPQSYPVRSSATREEFNIVHWSI